jgi:hypothetical protein
VTSAAAANVASSAAINAKIFRLLETDKATRRSGIYGCAKNGIAWQVKPVESDLIIKLDRGGNRSRLDQVSKQLRLMKGRVAIKEHDSRYANVEDCNQDPRLGSTIKISQQEVHTRVILSLKDETVVAGMQ